MKTKNILTKLTGLSFVVYCFAFGSALSSCKNSDRTFDDYEGGTSVYFAYQSPVRTIVLGDDDYDLTLDHAHKCQIQATFGGSYNGADGTVQIAVDPTLVQNLTFADGTPVKAMPQEYYSLSTSTLAFGGTFKGITEVQLNDAFFNDPEAVKNTYVIPVVMTGQTGFGRILTGTLKEGVGAAPRTDATAWEVKPMDYVLYCVKYQNKYAGYWLTNGNTSTDNIEKAGSVLISTRSMNSCTYTVSYQGQETRYRRDDSGSIVVENGQQQTETVGRTYTATMLLTFDGSEHCTISSLTEGVGVSGSGAWGDNSEKNAWGNKDRDGMELNYSLDFGKDELGNERKFATHEKMVWWRSGVKFEEFTPTYGKIED